jgi:hypothetical protein
MAVDATKLRRGVRRLGPPPTDSNPELSERATPSTPLATAGENLSGHQVPSAPLPQSPPADSPTLVPQRTHAPSQPEHFQPPPAGLAGALSGASGVRYPDGRSRRRTGRIEQINVKVSAQFNSDLRGLADRQGLLIVEVLERALDAYLRVVAVAEAAGRPVGQILDDLSPA